ncbi:MAG: AAA family ATPase [Candidatus Komeilibacteria bacterium]
MNKQPAQTINLEGYDIYWGKSYSTLSVLVDRIHHGIRLVWLGILWLLVAAGWVVFIWHIYKLIDAHYDFFLVSSWQGDHLHWWWFGILVMLYIFYYHQKDKGGRYTVLQPGDIDKHKKRESLDISFAFSRASHKAMERAYEIAHQDSGSAIQSLHIFASLLHDERVGLILHRLGVASVDIQQTTDRLIKNDGLISPTSSLNLDDNASHVVLSAYLTAYQRGDSQVEIPDLLSAVVERDVKVKEILFAYKLTEDQINNVIAWLRIQQALADRYRRYQYKAGFRPKGTMDKAMTAVATPTLDQYSDDFTALAKAGYFGLCVAREKEFNELYNILEGGGAPLLVGNPGVGVDSIIEGLANRMAADEVPAVLQDKRLVSLHISKLVAGATTAGELEERVMRLVFEISRAGNIALYINNLHNLVGIGAAGASNVDLADVLTESLMKRGMLVLGSTTPNDFRKYIEHSAFNNYFDKLEINEPDINQAIQMLEANIGSIEHKQEVFFSYEALDRAVVLSQRYIPDHFLPSKAINIVEEVAARVRSQRGKDQLVSGQDVAELISSKTDIPLTAVTSDESAKLLNLEELIHQSIVNQSEAVKVVSAALRRARAELRDTKRPIASFLFLGPTGVGKSELAKTLAAVYFGGSERMIRLDMSEYQEKNSLQRMLGTPGSNEGGILTEAVRESPYSILLLDEIEKAHPDILNIFLQVMEDGRLTDVTGRTVDFTNLIIIATSNAGTNYIQDQTKAGATAEQIKNALLESELRPYFRPEFLNRFDNIVVFKPLTQDHIEQIAVLLLNGQKKRLATKGIFLEATPAAIKELAIAGYDPKFGARPLRRVIQEQVENALANFLLKGKIDRRDKVILEAGGQIRVEKAQKL